MSYSYVPYENICVELKKSNFEPNSILDIGSNIGQTADIMRKVWPNSNLLLIEGNEDCCTDLYVKNYKVLPILVGKENSTVTFYKSKFHSKCSGNSIYKENSKYYEGDYLITESKKIFKLDDVVNDKFDLIKIDTQGSELDVIQGGRRTFVNAKVIIIEVSLKQFNIGGCTRQQILNTMSDMNFQYIQKFELIFDDNNPSDIIQENLLFIRK